MDLITYARTLGQLRAAGQPEPQMGRLDFYRGMARLGRALHPTPAHPGPPPTGLPDTVRGAAGDPLQAFRDLVMARPDRLRFRLLGANVHRLRSLAVEQRAALRVLEIEPDLLTPAGKGRSETAFAALLAYHLDPDRSPRLAPRLLEALLTRIGCEEAMVSDDALAEADVRAEVVIAGGRVDIQIETELFLVFVELKVDAGEGADQLGRYRRALARRAAQRGREGYLVYLTLPESDEPSEVPDAHLTWDDVLRIALPLAASRADTYFARYLKSIALLVDRTGPGSFADWSFYHQRRALELILGDPR